MCCKKSGREFRLGCILQGTVTTLAAGHDFASVYEPKRELTPFISATMLIDPRFNSANRFSWFLCLTDLRAAVDGQSRTKSHKGLCADDNVIWRVPLLAPSS
jgi:hypothetical protein